LATRADRKFFKIIVILYKLKPLLCH